MNERIAEWSPRAYARLTGVAYIIIFFAGFFAEFFVRSGLIVAEDAGATAANILASESLFRASFAGDLIMVICDVIVACLFYVLLKPVSKNLALIATFFRLIHAAILGANLLNHYFALLLLDGGSYLNAFTTQQLQATAMLFLEAHGYGYLIALVFFGVHCLLLGYLLIRSDLFPSVLGVLMLLAAIGYLNESFTYFLFPDFEEIASAIVVVTASIGELSLCLWLLIKGVRTPAAA